MISKYWEENRRIAQYASDTLRSPRLSKDLNGTCWITAYAVMQRSGAISGAEEARLIRDSSGGSLTVLGNSRNQIINQQEFASLEPGKVIAFVKPIMPGTPDRLSHVAIALGNGDIVGSNNNGVGGAPNWSKTSLRNIRFRGSEALISDIMGQEKGYKLYLIPFHPITRASCVVM